MKEYTLTAPPNSSEERQQIVDAMWIADQYGHVTIKIDGLHVTEDVFVSKASDLYDVITMIRLQRDVAYWRKRAGGLYPTNPKL